MLTLVALMKESEIVWFAVVKLWTIKTNECVNTFEEQHTDKVTARTIGTLDSIALKRRSNIVLVVTLCAAVL